MPIGEAWQNPAGGVRYHLRAWSNRDRWAPFRAALATWLGNFQAQTTRAVLVGPSAAYTFPDQFLRRFGEVTLLEPDPLAGFVLTRRLRRLGVAQVRVERRDLLLRPLCDAQPGLPELLAADPGLCVVFCNVLGQTPFLLEELEFERFKSAFRARVLPLLASRSWLSIHDRWSGNLAPSFAAPMRAVARLDDAGLRALYPSSGPDRTVELFDHQTDFFPSSLPHAYFTWQIDAARYHLVEGVASCTAPRGASHSEPRGV